MERSERDAAGCFEKYSFIFERIISNTSSLKIRPAAELF
jgi:hypothetical protein